MTTDDADNGWDSLAEEFGLPADKTSPQAEKPAPAPARSSPRPAPARPARSSRPEVEDEAEDFGAGVAQPEPTSSAVLYDPGPDAVADEDFDDAAPEPLDEGEEAEEGDEAAGEAEGGPEGQEGGKRRRRRRRRKKKGGPGAPEPEAAAPAEASEATDAQDDEVVEEGEAPDEVEEGDDDEPIPASAVEEEMVAEAAGPRPEWHVMTWMELVSKLYRPN
jgi:hypothetical protein